MYCCTFLYIYNQNNYKKLNSDFKNIINFYPKYAKVFILLFVCNLYANSFSQSKNSKNYKQQFKLQAELAVHHNSKTNTEVYYKIDTREILYTKVADTEKYTSKLLFKYTIYTNYRFSTILDTASFVLFDTLKNNEEKENSVLYGKFQCNRAYTDDNVLLLEITDLYRSQKNYFSIGLFHKNNVSSQNFLVKNNNTKTILFKPIVSLFDTINIETTSDINTEKLYIKYSNSETVLPPPPFAMIDSRTMNFKFTVAEVLPKTQNSFTYIFNKPGVYQISSDTSTNEGYLMFCKENNMPGNIGLEMMIKSLRYISTKAEYENLFSMDPKLSIEKFWTSIAGSNDKAKEFIKEYYSRVEYVNNNFTYYDWGWKSDRGLIYIVFGKPNSIVRDNNSESWSYGDENSYMRAVTFNFIKQNNSITQNEYVLNRSELYRESWLMKVDMWKSGRVIIDKNY
jgi:GWxTD domain-containing protein